MRYENFKIGRVPILTLIGRSKRGLSRRFVTKDSLDSEWDFITALNSILAHFLEHYKKLWPGRPFIPLENRKAFLVRNDYKDQLGITNPNEVYEQEGWFLNLPPVQGTA